MLFSEFPKAHLPHVGSLQGQQREAGCAELCAGSRASRLRAQLHGVSCAVDHSEVCAPAPPSRQSRAGAAACFLPALPVAATALPLSIWLLVMSALQRQEGSFQGSLPLQRSALLKCDQITLFPLHAVETGSLWHQHQHLCLATECYPPC